VECVAEIAHKRLRIRMHAFILLSWQCSSDVRKCSSNALRSCNKEGVVTEDVIKMLK
jgi:hypothetical protein